VYIELDLTSLPPRTELREPEDFKRFEIVASKPSHVFVELETLRQLAGERADDPDWKSRFDEMLDYAASKGWVDENGAVRAHVEWSGPGASSPTDGRSKT
jgi:hypothetical protein